MRCEPLVEGLFRAPGATCTVLCSSGLGPRDSEPPRSLFSKQLKYSHLHLFSVHQKSEVQVYQQPRCLMSHPLLIREALQPHYWKKKVEPHLPQAAPPQQWCSRHQACHCPLLKLPPHPMSHLVIQCLSLALCPPT